MSTINRLILASQSPYRKALLASTGLSFEQQVAPIDERLVVAKFPRDLAQKRSEAKAMAVAALAPGALVIGSDQVLSLDEEQFDKASSQREACERLTAMAGRVHFLHSGVVLAHKPADGAPRVLSSFVIDVAMPMRALTAAEIAAYVATGEWEGSVGCYQFENRGVHLFEAAGIAADHSTIIGLPLAPLLAELRRLGINGLEKPTPPWTLVELR